MRASAPDCKSGHCSDFLPSSASSAHLGVTVFCWAETASAENFGPIEPVNLQVAHIETDQRAASTAQRVLLIEPDI